MRFPVRILWLVDGDADVGIDCLYDGLASVMGPHRVIDWPLKALYHHPPGSELDAFCTWSYPVHGYTQEQIADELRSGAFDLSVITSDRAEVQAGLCDLIAWSPIGFGCGSLRLWESAAQGCAVIAPKYDILRIAYAEKRTAV